MGRERKNQLGTSNLSARLDNSTLGSNSSTILTNDFGAPSPAPTGSYVKTLTRSLLAPDSFQAATKTEKSEKKKETATWKPAKIYERDFGTVHNESFTDPVNRRNPHLPTPKSTYEIAKEQIELREEKDAVDNLCKLIRTSYGTVASMLRSVSIFIPFPLFSFKLMFFVSLLVQQEEYGQLHSLRVQRIHQAKQARSIHA